MPRIACSTLPQCSSSRNRRRSTCGSTATSTRTRSSRLRSTQRLFRETARVRGGGGARALRPPCKEGRALGRDLDRRRLRGLLRRPGRSVPHRRPQLETDAARPVYLRRLTAGNGIRDRSGRGADVPRLRRPGPVGPRSLLVLAVHPLLGSPGTLCDVSNCFLRVATPKSFLAGPFEETALMSFPLPAFDDSLPEIHAAPCFGAHGLSEV